MWFMLQFLNHPCLLWPLSPCHLPVYICAPDAPGLFSFSQPSGFSKIHLVVCFWINRPAHLLPLLFVTPLNKDQTFFPGELADWWVLCALWIVVAFNCQPAWNFLTLPASTSAFQSSFLLNINCDNPRCPLVKNNNNWYFINPLGEILLDRKPP